MDDADRRTLRPIALKVHTSLERFWLLGALAAVIGLFAIAFRVAHHVEILALLDHGRRVEGTVLGARHFKRLRRWRYMVRYSYEVDGVVLQAEARITRVGFSRLRVGAPIPVHVADADPTKSAVPPQARIAEEVITYLPQLIPLLVFLAAASGWLFGIARRRRRILRHGAILPFEPVGPDAAFFGAGSDSI